MIYYNMISLYFFVMVISVVYWTSTIRSLNGSSYTHTTVLLSIAVCIYICGYCMELNSYVLPQILFWNKIEYLGIPFVSALWLTVALMYTGHFFRYKKLLLSAIFIIPFVTLILRLTNDYHFFYFASISFASEYGRLLLVKTPGPWLYVQLVHSMLMIITALGLLIHDSFKRSQNKSGKMNLIIAASLFAASGLIFSLTKPFGFAIDYMALSLPAACLMVILAIMRYDFFEVKFMARGKAFESGRDAVLLINNQHKVIDYNESAKQLLKKINIDVSDGYISSLFKNVPDLMKSLDSKEISIVKLIIDAQERYYEISTKSIGNNRVPQGSIKTVRDITETHELHGSLTRQAMMDELSGLSNRRAFMSIGNKLRQEAETSGESLHLLMMDLDHFKIVNDQYGHQMGDKIIKDFGDLLKSQFRSSDMVARLGGEEFGVILYGLSDSEVKQKADAVLSSIKLHEYSYKNKSFYVTVSIGIAKMSTPSQTLDNLIHLADKALYASKNNGRNCVTVS